jgi:deoxyribodipyrimidine photo-lyase
MFVGSVPEERIRCANQLPVREDGRFVLYWMIAFRRLNWNFALDRALEWARRLGKPLVILEALRCDYPWASDRLHQFVIDGMIENARRCERTGATYFPYVEGAKGAGRGLLLELTKYACTVVTDDYPCFFLPRMVESAARAVPIRMEAIDSNGLLPMRCAVKTFSTAHSFRRYLQKELGRHLLQFPKSHPFRGVRLPPASALPTVLRKRWPVTPVMDWESALSTQLARIPINHEVTPVGTRGGSARARRALRAFVRDRLENYATRRNVPSEDATSGLSGYLHFGYISSHEIFSEIAAQQNWSPQSVGLRPTGSRAGWWGMSESAEAFLDQVVTWRELGFNFCHTRGNCDQLESLPAWALKTLKRHARDERAELYSLQELERAKTHDPLWNAAQIQLLHEGRIHNYLRMLWGKKIIEWSKSPREALRIMLELNNKYALDGRDPNSYSGIFWCLGRYDRPWGPERAVFGTVRYMSSNNTARKFDVRGYLRKYGAPAEEIN